MSILGPPQQPGILGPRIPFASNPVVSALAAGLLSGRKGIGQGLENFGQMLPGAMAVKAGMQRDMTAQQEKAAADAEAKAKESQQHAAFNAWAKAQSGVSLSPADIAVIEANPDMGRMLFGESLKAKFAGPAPGTDDMREYDMALSQGYDGSFVDFQKEMKAAGASTTKIDNVGSIPQGYELYTDPVSGAKQMRVIPGGPAEVSERSADVVRQAGAENQAVKAETMLDATQSIKNEFKNASMPVTGTLSRPFAMLSSTAAGRVRSYVASLQSGVALQAMLKLKEASSTGATGFGALSAPELNLLITDIGSLNPDNTEPDIFLKTVDRIEDRWKNVLQDVQRTVPPERLAEMGIDINALTGMASGGSGAPAAAAPVYTSPTGVKVYAE